MRSLWPALKFVVPAGIISIKMLRTRIGGKNFTAFWFWLTTVGSFSCTASAVQLPLPTSLVGNEVVVSAVRLSPNLGDSKDWSSQKVHELRYQLEIKGVQFAQHSK